jgi:phenylpyruvate tautomerase PptA (4-oxalocrotonate tautomerase family)
MPYVKIEVTREGATREQTRPLLEVHEAYLDRFLNTNLKGTYFTPMAISTQLITHNK